MPISLRAMRYVQAAMRQGNIAAAAQAMNVAPSAVATALKQAEEAFDVTLATRVRSKGISPTLSGRDILRRIDDLLERYDAMIAEASDMKTDLSGNVTIGYNAPIAPAFLSKICARLQAAHPQITFTCVDGDNETVKQGLIEGRLDVIYFVDDLPNPQIEARPLIFAPTYCLCRPDHAIASAGPVPLRRILEEPLILLDRPAARAYYLELFERTGVAYQIVATADSTEMVRSLVAEGLGVSLLNMRPGRIPAYAGSEVACVPLADSAHGVTLSLGTAPGPKRWLIEVFAKASVAFFASKEGADFIVSA